MLWDRHICGKEAFGAYGKECKVHTLPHTFLQKVHWLLSKVKGGMGQKENNKMNEQGSNRWEGFSLLPDNNYQGYKTFTFADGFSSGRATE